MPTPKFVKKQGFALMFVLIVLVLVAMMAMLFLTAVGQERKGVDMYASGSMVNHLKGMAVNRVIGQINAATKEGTASAPIAWASQPGMLRTYDATGTAANIYKLYSWDTAASVAAAGFNPSDSSETVSSGWKNSPGLFTDLNQPVNSIYPIVDPSAAGKVEGFSIDETNAAVAGSDSKAPMPVRWLYVLEEGQLVAPSSESGSSVTIPGAGASNQIVGRVAFWTDDETSKVNINTASEGAFWDVPRGATRDEMQFAANPPVKFEFQRTPGHPAMTSLSAVFPELMTADRWADTATYRTELTGLYNLTPRIQGGGSLGGSFPVSSYSTDYSLAPPMLSMPTKISLDSDRLYASADELWFKAADPAAPITGRTENPALSALGASELHKRLFFLTASSRAPETTLFETPRVSLWPVTWPYPSSYFKTRGSAPSAVSPTSAIDQNPWMTPEERLLAFCSTINVTSSSPLRYYFQRQNPDSPTHDWSNISRNQELVGYLRRTFDRNIPAFGGNLATHWGASNADWIALNSFDFSRSMINQVTRAGTATKSVTAGVNEVGYSFTGLTAREIYLNGTRKLIYQEPNAYTVSPLRITLNGNSYTTQGAFPKLSQAAVVFYASTRREPVPPIPVPSSPNPPARATAGNPENDYYNPFNWQYLTNAGPGYGGSAAYPVGSQTTQMRAVMLFDFAGMGQGDSMPTPMFWIKVKGSSFSVNGSSIGLPASGGRAVQWTSIMKNSPAQIRPIFYPLFQRDVTTPKIFDNGATTSASRWSLISDPIAMDPDQVTFPFTGTPVTIEIYAPYSTDADTNPTDDSGQLVSSQTVKFDQWNGTLPIPIAPRWNARDVSTDTAATATHRPLPSTTNFTTPETRRMNWAYTEIVPYTSNSTNPISSAVRDTTTASRSLAYAYMNDSGSLVSPNFENRLKALGMSRVGVVTQGPFLAQQTGADLFGAAVNTPFLEALPLITPYDTVISMVPDATAPSAGDLRLATSGTFRRIDAVMSGSQPDELFRTAPADASLTSPAYPRATARSQWHALASLDSSGPLSTGYRINSLTFDGSPMAQQGWNSASIGNLGSLSTSPEGAVGGSFNVTGKVNSAWDWTMMPGNRMDGGLLARPDQDYQILGIDYSAGSVVATPYFMLYGAYGAQGSNYFSPSRQVSSPVILGTLPTSLTTGWQTLAFSPNPAAGSSHPGLATPPDHLLLDLFWMPVAEPYPISDEFSTAGKVNLNYAIMPFSYIERKTALYAALKPVWISALPDSAANVYKAHAQVRGTVSQSRFPIDVDKTLADFDSKFAAGEIFRSASQICEMFLVPKGESLASTKSSFWNGKRLTADNSREQPYDHLYSRVTTKSNTYTVHWRVQALRKLPSTGVGVWQEGRDKVAGELRGSTLIERYLDSSATNIPDYAIDNTAKPLSNFYKWRVISESFFQP